MKLVVIAVMSADKYKYVARCRDCEEQSIIMFN
jgi:hypothetical protein